MKYLKVNLFFFSLFIVNFATAQNATNIIGKWQNEEDGATTKCYFFEYQGKLHGLVYYYSENGDRFSLIESLKAYQVEKVEDLSAKDIFEYLSEYVWFKDFKKNGKAWNGKLIYIEEETYEEEATLRLINSTTSEVNYFDQGQTETKTWKRLN